MRRPSLQGLLSLCLYVIDTAGHSELQRKTQDRFSLLPVKVNSVRDRGRAYPALCLTTSLAIILLTTSCVLAQKIPTATASSATSVPMLAYFAAVRAGHHPPLSDALAGRESESHLLEDLQPFLLDSVDAVRAKAYDLASLIASGSSDSALRHAGTAILVQACKDSVVENCGLALELLTHFRKKDFSSAVLDSMRRYIRSGRCRHLDQAMKIAGFLGLKDLVDDIRPYAQPGNTVPIRWAALLSLARMGEHSAVSEVAKRVKKFPINDDVVYQLFPDLLFTRQRDLISIAIDALKKDERSCLSADAERQVPIPCGYRIMEMLAPIIDGYPLRLDESGDLAVSDYPAALDRVRNFFDSQTDYKIVLDTY
jgi:hypothetical protein